MRDKLRGIAFPQEEVSLSSMVSSPKPEPSYRFGVYEVLPESGEILRQGQRVKIQDQPFRLLLALLEHPGKIVAPGVSLAASLAG